LRDGSCPLANLAASRTPLRTFRCGAASAVGYGSHPKSIQHLSWVEWAIGSAKPLSSISRSAGSQVRVICIPAMFPISTTMQSLIDAWEEAQASGKWVEPAPEPIYPAAWWLIQLGEEPQELDLPLRWSV
jgi:hypothetical protein